MSGNKCIRISEDTYHDLTKLGTLQDTFDSVIARLVDASKEKGESKI